jgi:hypothetical protein
VADSPADGATAIAFRVESQPFVGGPLGGEHLYRELVLVGRHTLGGEFRVDPIINDVVSPVVSATIDGVFLEVQVLPVTFSLPAQAPGAELREFSVAVPLVRRLLINGNEFARWYLRGERFAVRLTPTGTLSEGTLAVDGGTLDHDEVRRTDHVFTGGGATAGVGGGLVGLTV